MKAFRFSFLAALLGVAVLVLDGTAFGQDAWQSVTAKDGSFSIEMPGQPNYSTHPLKTASGAEYTYFQYLLETSGPAYVVQVATYPQSVDVSNTRRNLQSALDNAAKQMNDGKWTSIRWTTYQGLTACDAVGVKSDGGIHIRNFSVMKGSTIYTLTYGGSAGTAQSADANRFINSFLITK